jgi:hypothetical protein
MSKVCPSSKMARVHIDSLQGTIRTVLARKMNVPRKKILTIRWPKTIYQCEGCEIIVEKSIERSHGKTLNDYENSLKLTNG